MFSKEDIITHIKTIYPDISSFKRLGVGEGNLNYVFTSENKKFICRINIDPKMPNKSKAEYTSLKIVEHLNIAPKAYYLHEADKLPSFIILEYFEGMVWRKKKRSYSSKQIKTLAELLAKMHLIKPNLPRKQSLYRDFIKSAEEYIRSIKKNSELWKINEIIKNKLPSEEHVYSLIHGDLCPQNIIEINSKLKLIDWESIAYSDPARDVANILVDFGLKGTNFSLFLSEYSKYRTDVNLLQRARVYELLSRYTYFLWEIVRAFEIRNKELPEEYMKSTSFEEHISEAKYQYRQLRKLVKLPELTL